jgi:hypothetical protein
MRKNVGDRQQQLMWQNSILMILKANSCQELQVPIIFENDVAMVIFLVCRPNSGF